MAQEGREITVKTCHDCPFVVMDNEFGYTSCNLSEEVTDSLKGWEELPRNKIHKLCPLKNGEYTVKL